jgi:hypothetical protein
MVGRRFLSFVLCLFCLCFLSGSVVLAQDNEEVASAPLANEGAGVELAPAAESLVQIQPEEPLVSTPLQAPPAMSAEQTVVSPEVAPVPLNQTEAAKEPEKTPEKALEWVWGEVIEVAPEKKEIIIKHLDYETYEEVQMALVVTDKTSFENASQLKDIRLKDHVTVDYYVKDGANICEFIVIEKNGDSKTSENVSTPQAETALEEENKSAETAVANMTSATIPDSSQSPVMGTAPSGVMNFTQGAQGAFGQMPEKLIATSEASMGGVLNETKQ